MRLAPAWAVVAAPLVLLGCSADADRVNTRPAQARPAGPMSRPLAEAPRQQICVPGELQVGIGYGLDPKIEDSADGYCYTYPLKTRTGRFRADGLIKVNNQGECTAEGLEKYGYKLPRAQNCRYE
ncbi:MAG: hypothetical protein KGQ41_07225 [Alphaproteobacteria bacterium]|nr:hypothetical protein [Alphaproteobacteria bacterium]